MEDSSCDPSQCNILTALTRWILISLFFFHTRLMWWYDNDDEDGNSSFSIFLRDNGLLASSATLVVLLLKLEVKLNNVGTALGNSFFSKSKHVDSKCFEHNDAPLPGTHSFWLLWGSTRLVFRAHKAQCLGSLGKLESEFILPRHIRIEIMFDKYNLAYIYLWSLKSQFAPCRDVQPIAEHERTISQDLTNVT